MIDKITIRQFRILALVEGVSYLCFAFTMPLKYVLEIGMPNYIVGMLHGVVFLLYCLWLLVLTLRKSWTWPRGFLFFIASLVPFGTFYIDARYLKKAQ